MLYILILLMIVGGFSLFFFRDSILDILEERVEMSVPAMSPQSPSETEALDLSVLDSPIFSGLVENVVDFDFDNICYRPSGRAAIVIPSAGEDEPVRPALGCVLGSNLPFISN